MAKAKNLDKEMQEALKVAQEIERQEEEEMMKKAIAESESYAKQATIQA